MEPIHKCDVLVIGAGIMGCALAYDLAREGIDVVLLDRGMVCGGSSGLNAGGVRHQFTNELNARLATRSIERIVQFQQEWGLDFGFHAVGYLFLVATEQHDGAFRETVALQNQWGVPSRYLSPDEIAALVPGIYTDDLRGGAFCPTDGYLDPHSLVSGFADAARRAGTVVTQNAQVVGLETGSHGVTGVVTARHGRYSPDVVVNAAGVWAPAIAQLYGGTLPIIPWRSQLFAITHVPDLGERLPMTIDFDHGKAYFHRDGAGIIAGMDNETSSALTWDVPCDWKKFPSIAERLTYRVPALEEAEVTHGWAGFLELTPDENPIVGWTDLDNMYTAAGFSGHGLSIAPGLAPEVAREIQRLPTTLPLDDYRRDRFAAGVSADGEAEALSMR